MASTLLAKVRGDESSMWRHADLVLLALPFALSALGLLMIYSSSRTRLKNQGLSQLYYVERQGLAIVLGVVAMAIVLAIDYRRLRDLWAPIYVAALAVLVSVLFVGERVKGAQAWFQVGPLQFQPSEIAKVAVVIALAGYCHHHRNDLDTGRLAVAVAIAGIAMALVFMQHDLGTTLVILVCSFAVLVVAGLRPAHIGVLVLIGVTLVGAAVVSGKVATYRVDRITGFLDQSSSLNQPASKQTEAQYSLTESKIAIVSGGISGQGLFKGRQTNLSYVPEQHTDFIFTVVGEELGFLGGATLIGLYSLLAWRIWRTARLSSDFFGTLLAVGVLGILAFQVFENIGMTMGIMPITGIPLPFMSYGGSAIIASFVAIGLVANVHMRRFS
jgi:rod shape determining protein RodA